MKNVQKKADTIGVFARKYLLINEIRITITIEMEGRSRHLAPI